MLNLRKTYENFETKLWRDVAHRPNASKGLWLICLLPIIGVQLWLKFPLSRSYRMSILAIDACFFMNIAVLFSSRELIMCTVAFMTVFSTVYFNSLAVGFLMFLACTTFITILRQTMKHHWKSFTVGECSLLCQGLVGFLISVIYNGVLHTGEHTIDDTTKILQAVLFCVFVFTVGLWKIPSLRDPAMFYPWLISVGVVGLMTLASVELKHNLILWVTHFLMATSTRVALLLWFALLCILAVGFVVYAQENTEKSIVEVVEKKEPETKARSRIPLTVLRKVFHVLIVCVDIPGLLWDRELIYFSTGIILGLFVLVEVIRLLEIPPFGPIIYASFKPLLDEKDGGMLVLTNIYLLLGCSAPMWLYPLPFDKQDSSAILPMAAGVLTLGVGDTAASLIGTYFGKSRWPGSKKTLEGTIGCVMVQMFFIYAVQALAPGFVDSYSWSKIATACAAAALVEAFTTQVDNLVLPLVFMIFILL